MLEKQGDLFESGCDLLCVTTNGIVKPNNELVMGKSIALQFKEKWPELPRMFGACVKRYGNLPAIALTRDFKQKVASIPTKNHYKDDSDPALIVRSITKLVSLIDAYEDKNWIKTIALTRPGCGNGGLQWEHVKKMIESLLDDRFTVYY